MSWTLRRPANPCTVPTPPAPTAARPAPGRSPSSSAATARLRALPPRVRRSVRCREDPARTPSACAWAIRPSSHWRTLQARGRAGRCFAGGSQRHGGKRRQQGRRRLAGKQPGAIRRHPCAVSASRPGLGLISTLAHRLWSLSNCAASARLGSGSSAKRGENQAPASSRDSTFHDSASAGPWPSVVRSSVSSCSKTARRQRTGARQNSTILPQQTPPAACRPGCSPVRHRRRHGGRSSAARGKQQGSSASHSTLKNTAPLYLPRVHQPSGSSACLTARIAARLASGR